MATLTQLYARIILDLNRDDMGSGGELEQAKIDAVADAIEMHAGEQFWFNRASGTVSTVAGTATVALPAGMRMARVVTWLGKALRKVPLEKILAAENSAAPVSGPPCLWAEDQRLIPEAEAWGRAMGCTAAIVESRSGWMRALKLQGYEPHQIALRKEL